MVSKDYLSEELARELWRIMGNSCAFFHATRGGTFINEAWEDAPEGPKTHYRKAAQTAVDYCLAPKKSETGA
jgi:hypothetical protein